MRRKIIFIVIFFLVLITEIFITKNYGNSVGFESRKREVKNNDKSIVKS